MNTELFELCRLEIVLPGLIENDLPDNFGDGLEEWLGGLGKSGQREVAFYDEQLLSFLILRLPLPRSLDRPQSKSTPPPELLTFLAHLQISIHASYVPPSVPAPILSQPSRLLLPPNSRPTSLTAAAQKLAGGGNAAAAFNKRFSAVGEAGIAVQSSVWGEELPPASASSMTGPGACNDFALMWSEKDGLWIAVYKLDIAVVFMQTHIQEPFLSVIVSATLRDNVVITRNPHTEPLAKLLIDGGIISPTGTHPNPLNGVNGNGGGVGDESEDDEDDLLNGLDEVNLLEGLSNGVTFAQSSSSKPLSFPSTRLSPSVRWEAFSLPPMTPPAFSITLPTPTTPSPISPLIHKGHHLKSHSRSKSISTFRKSTQRHLRAVSGIRVRMRNCFIPYMIHTNANTGDEAEEMEREEERREAGGEERTVVLCVEIENSPESGLDFIVEKVEIKIGGEGAVARLISWGEGEREKAVFPLKLEVVEQYNLLYAISFLQPQQEVDPATLGRRRQSGLPTSSAADFQRSVSILITGHPDHPGSQQQNLSSDPKLSNSFSSRWNCILDLSPFRQPDLPTSPLSERDALPTPPSPFPAASPRQTTIAARLDKPVPLLPPSAIVKRALMAPSSMSAPPSNRFSLMQGTPGANQQSTFGISYPAALNPPSLQPPPPSPNAISSPPPTPAYPSYPNTSLPPTPHSQSPMHLTASEYLDSPHPPKHQRESDNTLISFALSSKSKSGKIIRPFDVFTLSIFVLNKSNVVRKCEISYPEPKRLRVVRREVEGRDEVVSEGGGIVPVENRVRIGPLHPGTCQSTEMQFMALSPGVHSIDALVLTDVNFNYSLNLRSVMHVVVHNSA